MLAIETTTVLLGVAVLRCGDLMFESCLYRERAHSSSLLPLCIQALDLARVSARELDCVAVSAGPGSFTGLRIGFSVAKGLAFALEKPVVPVPTFEVLLRQCSMYDTIAVVQGKARGQTVTALYSRLAGGVHTVVLAPGPRSFESFRQEMAEFDVGLVRVTGDAAEEFCRAYRQVLCESVASVDIAPVPRHLLLPRPSIVARIGEELFLQGKAVDASFALPVYLRPPSIRVTSQGQGESR